MQAKVLPASVPHERMMLNLALFHILLPIVALASGFVLPILLLAMVGSLLTIGWIGWFARHHHFASDKLEQHWLLSLVALCLCHVGPDNAGRDRVVLRSE